MGECVSRIGLLGGVNDGCPAVRSKKWATDGDKFLWTGGACVLLTP